MSDFTIHGHLEYDRYRWRLSCIEIREYDDIEEDRDCDYTVLNLIELPTSVECQVTDAILSHITTPNAVAVEVQS
jgi:hypothetical protein